PRRRSPAPRPAARQCGSRRGWRRGRTAAGGCRSSSALSTARPPRRALGREVLLDAGDRRVADARLSFRDRARPVIYWKWRWSRVHVGAVGLQPAPVPGTALQAIALVRLLGVVEPAQPGQGVELGDARRAPGLDVVDLEPHPHMTAT